MALKPAYITVAEADVLLEFVSPWNTATDEDKTAALDMGRLYLDTKYICVDFDESAPPDSVKDANGYLGNCHLQGRLFNYSSSSTGRLITEETVKAGSVSSTTKYSDTRGQSTQSSDPCPEATAILAQDDTCRLTTGTTGQLVRA